MDSPWRRTIISVFIIISLNDVTVFSQNLPPPGGPLLLPLRNRECAITSIGSPSQVIPPLLPLPAPNGIPPDSMPVFRPIPPDIQRALLLQEGIELSIINLPPAPFTGPCSQVPITNPPQQFISAPASSSSLPFPIVSASLIPPGMTPAPTVPSPALTLSQNLITTAPLPPDLLSLSYPVPSMSDVWSIPYAQPQLIPCNNRVLVSSDMCWPPPNFQIPLQSYPPVLLEPGTAKIIPFSGSNPTIPFDIYPAAGTLPDVDMCSSNFQITSLPPVFFEPQGATGTFLYPSANSFSNSVEEDTSNQLPISLQINMPPAPAPVVSIISALPPFTPYPPFSGPSPSGMYSPMVIGGSRSKRKSWLPILLIALLSSDRGCCGGCGGGDCGCCCPCDCSDPIPIPYPIPIPTNNPIIVGKSRSMSTRGSKRDGCDERDRKLRDNK